jgi:hypothetical protein
MSTTLLRPSLPAGTAVIGGYFAARVAVGAVVALPLASAVGAITGGLPRGDAALWEPGGVMLLETGRLLEPMAAGIARSSAAFLLVGLFALLLPLGALVASFGPAPPAGPRRRPPARQLLGRAGESWGTLCLTQGIVLLGQALLLGLFDLVGRLLARSLELGYEGQQLTELAVLAVGLGAAWVLGLAQDVARIAVVQHRRGLLGALEVTRRVLGSGFWRVLLGGAWRGVLAAAMLLGAGWVGISLDPTRPGQAVLVAVVHLAGVLGAVLVRVSWLRWLTDRVVLAWGPPREAVAVSAD